MAYLSSEEIQLTERFDDRAGGLVNYTAYDGGQLDALRKQRHRDIRVFEDIIITRPRKIYEIEQYTVEELDDLTIDQMEYDDEGSYQENWTVGTIQTISGWRNLVVPVNGSVTTKSETRDMDLLSDFDDEDFISVSLPNFPAGSLDLDACYVSFTSSFEGEEYSSTFPLDTVTNNEFRIERGELFEVYVNPSREELMTNLTTVEFHFVSTTSTSVKVNAIRLLGKDWVEAPVDTNTILRRLIRPVPLNGISPVTAFPENEFVDPQVPTTWPILFRSDVPTSSDDPHPIDLSVAAVVNTGNLDLGSRISLYFRELAMDPVTQLDLETDQTTMADLDALNSQPDYGIAKYLARTQDNLDLYNQTELDGTTQRDLEAIPDNFSAAWLEVTWEWGKDEVNITDTEGNNYPFTIDVGLLSFSRYALLVELEENGIRAKIVRVRDDNTLAFDEPYFDSTLIDDDVMAPRRAGRFGWYAELPSSASYVETISTFSSNYAEYRSHPFESTTPVDGVQVFYGGTPAEERWTGLEPFRDSKVEPEYIKSSSGKSHRIETTIAVDGADTNFIDVENFRDLRASLDVFYPTDSKALGGRLLASMVNRNGTEFALNFPEVPTDSWHRVDFTFERFHGRILPGFYKFRIVDLAAGVTFYLDNFSVRTPSIVFSARTGDPDPWNDDYGWLPFKECVNEQTSGLLLGTRGRFLQVQGKARSQTADLSSVQIVPRYAQLGRLVYDKAAVRAPTIDFTTDLDEIVNG